MTEFTCNPDTCEGAKTYTRHTEDLRVRTEIAAAARIRFEDEFGDTQTFLQSLSPKELFTGKLSIDADDALAAWTDNSIDQEIETTQPIIVTSSAASQQEDLRQRDEILKHCTDFCNTLGECALATLNDTYRFKDSSPPTNPI